VSPRLLELTLPVFSESASGYGFEFLWTRLLVEHDMKLPMIFDGTPITHTRPIGGGDRGIGDDVKPFDEMRALFKKYNVTDERKVTLAGVLTSGEVLDGVKSRDRLALHLVRDALAVNKRMSQELFASSLDSITREVSSDFPWLLDHEADALLQCHPY
jgi:hypothetical protein